MLGQYLRRNLSDLLELPLGRFTSQRFDDFADVRAHLERLVREKELGLVFAVTRRASISGLIQCLHRELWGQGDVSKLDAWLGELTACLALELAVAGSLPPDGFRLRGHVPRVTSIPRNLALQIDPPWTLGFLPERVVLTRGSERHELPLASGPGAAWPAGVRALRPYHDVAGGMVLAELDNNPLYLREAHPEKFGNELSLGDHPTSEWVESLRAAFELVDAHLPDLGAEMRLVSQLLVPVGWDPERHFSASYGEVVGTSYLTLHPDRMTMTEALIHEFSHNKINALFRLDAVLENAFSPLYASPVRPDPRPLHGVLLAVHAFVPVARVYELMLAAGHPLSRSAAFSDRLRHIAKGNHEGTATLLEHARPTAVGRGVLDEIARWDAHFAPFR